ncbi:putative MFS family arabinose efflux permease [Nocardioides zeae]|uniref:MFS family arabinose efflux permease n=1 Tax=Nocardioides zeae TaxID=1457234 RepID=A0AAJ1X0D2_9ACTN|nr:putative MFS family arabinose efflux permease [Nocardioides zeae]
MADTAPGSPADVAGERTSRAQWSTVAVLTASTFVVVTAEMLPVGVLTPMAAGLGITSGAAGTSLTVTGLVAAVTAPVVPRLLGDADRRHVLAVAMLALVVGNVLTALADGFATLIGARVVLGVGMGTVWGLAAAVATRLVAPRDVALAVSFTVSGVAGASVLGVPLGTFVGNAFGWRTAFGVLAGAGLVLALALLLVLPRLEPQASAVDAPTVARASLLRPGVVTGLVVVVLLVTAHFAAYTYVRPVLEDLPAFSGDTIALLLLVYGAFGLAGNFAAGALAARRARGTVVALAAGIAASVALLAGAGGVGWVAVVAVSLWGVAYGGLSVAAQLWMTQAAPDRTEHVTGLYVGVFTAAIALGAFVGGIGVEAFGVVALLSAAAVVAALALVVAALGPGAARPPQARSSPSSTSR